MVRNRFLVFFFLLLSLAVSAQNTKRQESRKAALQKEIEVINRQLKENSRSNARALSSLQLVRKKIDNRKELLAESDMEIKALDDSIRLREAEIKKLERQLDTLSLYYERLVRSAYKSRDGRIWYMYLLSSDRLGQAVRRMSYLRGFSKEMNRQAVAVQETTTLLKAQKDTLSVLKSGAETVREERRKDMELLRIEESESQTLIAQLNSDRKKYQRELEKKNREIEALNREIAELIRKATAKDSAKSSKGTSKKGSAKSTSTTVDTRLNAEFASNKGRLPWPVSGTVVERFGSHNHPVYKNVKMPFNNGVTIAVDPGAPVKAVFDGTVYQVVIIPGYNQCVLVQHGEYFTFYCKMKDVSVKSGEKVRTGTSLGTVDTIGGETQFHFQIWSGRTPQNPEAWLK